MLLKLLKMQAKRAQMLQLTLHLYYHYFYPGDEGWVQSGNINIMKITTWYFFFTNCIYISNYFLKITISVYLRCAVNLCDALQQNREQVTQAYFDMDNLSWHRGENNSSVNFEILYFFTCLLFCHSM